MLEGELANFQRNVVTHMAESKRIGVCGMITRMKLYGYVEKR